MSRILDAFTDKEDLQRLHASHIELLVRGWRADLMRLEAAEGEIGKLTEDITALNAAYHACRERYRLLSESLDRNDEGPETAA